MSALGRSLGGSWAVNPSVPGVKRVRVDGMADATEDEVFEEEESAEVEGGLARHCHPDYVRGRRIQGLTPFRRPLPWIRVWGLLRASLKLFKAF